MRAAISSVISRAISSSLRTNTRTRSARRHDPRPGSRPRARVAGSRRPRASGAQRRESLASASTRDCRRGHRLADVCELRASAGRRPRAGRSATSSQWVASGFPCSLNRRSRSENTPTTLPVVHDRYTGDAALNENRRSLLERCRTWHGDHVARHHVTDFHRAPPWVTRPRHPMLLRPVRNGIRNGAGDRCGEVRLS